jgi:hypothetical protein
MPDLEQIKDATIAAFSGPAREVRDGDQHVVLRTAAELRDAASLCSELEDLAAGEQPGIVVVCPTPVTL